MPIRPFFLLALLFAASTGCSPISNERLARLEAAADAVDVQEIRIALLEDKVNTIIAGPPAPLEGQADGRSGAGSASAGSAASGPKAKATARTTPIPRPVPSSGNPRRDYQRALSTLQGGKPVAARPLFAGFVRAYPSDALAPNAEYWLGECFYSMKEYTEAINVFKDVVVKFPAHPKAAAAMLKAGYAYDLLGDKENARFYLETLIKDFPQSPPAGLARQRLAAL